MVNTPTVTPHIPYFLEGYLNKMCRGISDAQDGIEDGFFYVISRRFWMEYGS